MDLGKQLLFCCKSLAQTYIPVCFLRHLDGWEFED
jgi:hypothetical protein